MKSDLRQRRRIRIRARLSGTAARPRVTVYRSARFVEVQLVDDEQGKTLMSLHGKNVKAANKIAQALEAGKQLALKAKAAGITTVVFDRSGYKYHGRVKAVVEGLRASGLKV